ncbi:MAG: AIM24 family protein [Ruminococcus flavefaciens]|nr:AIM24 family protein [Ruminococcus flavefaciens]
MNILNLENSSRKIINKLGNFSVLEYERDISVSSNNAMTEYFMAEMGVRRRQVVINMNGSNTAILQAGAMQWTAGDIEITTDVKGVGDFVGKMFKSSVTKETAVKPKYSGNGILVLEPTYKYIILKEVSEWQSGLVIEDGMFLACDGTVNQGITARKNVSSAVLGGEGLFNLSLTGKGVVALESNVPEDELIEIHLDNDELRIDGNMAVCWSKSLEFTVEKATKTFIGSAVSGEGFVNVYRGTGTVLMAPVTSSSSLFKATNNVSAKP